MERSITSHGAPCLVSFRQLKVGDKVLFAKSDKTNSSWWGAKGSVIEVTSSHIRAKLVRYNGSVSTESFYDSDIGRLNKFCSFCEKEDCPTIS